MKKTNERLLPLLIEVQRDLDQDIDLASLATRFGTSPFHFHRTFADALGETPKKHVERLRLERAASLLAVTDQPILEIALAVGFKNPETLSRNFRKFLGYSPSGYRQAAKRLQAERVAHTDFHSSDAYALSRARFEKLPSAHLLAVRHMGHYGALRDRFGNARNPWSELLAWAQAAGVAVSPPCIGIYYDDPTLTPEPLQRADICIGVHRPVAGTAKIRCIEFGGGPYGIVEYVGRTATVLNAFRGLADEIRRSPSFVFRDGPPLEIVRATNVNGTPGVDRIDVCFPVKRRNRP